MSGWKALNIESDDESDIEIDDTKELQIEDALKLYQNAVTLHAQGPASYELAAEAYEELFQSEIFKYPESQTELRRIELYGTAPEIDDYWQDGAQAGILGPPGGAESGPSHLAYVLHLSHKNYAQFKLDYLTARLETFNLTLNQILIDAAAALDHFVSALDKDDTDVELWQKTAGVGEMLESKRIARFCLEAVLDSDDEGLGNLLSLPGLNEGLAGEQLRELVTKLQDQLSLLQSPLSAGKRRALTKKLRRRLGPYREIQAREKALRYDAEPQKLRELSKVVLDAPSTWAGVGESLMRQGNAEQHGTSSGRPPVTLAYDLSSIPQPSPELMPPPIMTQSLEPENEGANVEGTAAPNENTSDDADQSAQLQPNSGNDNEQPDPPRELDGDTTMAESPTMTLPTRKRSGDAAGLLNEGPEEGRSKSKRTRTRESTTGEDKLQTLADANIRWELEQKMEEMQKADEWMFGSVGELFERIGIIDFDAGKNVRQELSSPRPTNEDATNGVDHGKEQQKLAKSDLQAWLNNYSDQLAQFLTVSSDSSDGARSQNASGLGGSLSNASTSKALVKAAPMSDDDVFTFLQEVNDDWLHTQEVAWKWVCKLLRPDPASQGSTYCKYLWPEHLKTVVVRTLVNFDEGLFDRARDDLEISQNNGSRSAFHSGLAEMAEAIFELHLDVFCLIKEPNSGVDEETIAAQRDRLQRWSELAREAMQLRSMEKNHSDSNDDLDLRFFWATTFHLGASADVTQDHVLECMDDLRAIFVAADEPTIQLQNNAIMPELSVAALDKEISRLTTKDFFLKVTTQDQGDPVAMIESLEPLLTSLDSAYSDPETSNDTTDDMRIVKSVPDDLVRFVQSSEISIRLLLWHKLVNAYSAIEYKPMIVSCYFKMIRMLLFELKASLAPTTQQHDRQVLILKTLRQIQEMTKKVLGLVHNSKEAFECIDEDGLKSAVGSLGEVLQLLQVFNVFEDPIRIGTSPPLTLANGQTPASFANVKTLVHEMQIHIWVILYSLLKEAMFQFNELFPNAAEDKFEFLKSTHRNLGLREICGASNSIYVRMLKDELFQMTHLEGSESEQAQVLYDLYGLKCFIDTEWELMEHGCTHDAFIDRSVALQAVDLLLRQTSKMSIKDLAKHTIKDTIDRVHGVAPRKKPTEAIMRNRDIYRSFLRSAINPLDLYKCLKGEGNRLDIYQIPRDDAVLASKGWFFLMGHIALVKFRSQKRTAPTPTEDVDIAIAFFMQDLEYSMDNWETWFRLAQAYDTKIDENVVWSAEKVNNSMSELVQLQRAAIHCYTMATALAYRSADPSSDTSDKMSEMFSDFAIRLYASTREPFSMQPFALDDVEKFFSRPTGVAKGKPFQPLRVYTAWKLARTFFQKALKGRPQSWTLHFMLGKCLWKMHAASEYVRGRDVPPNSLEVLHSFKRAIELIPDEKKKDSREKREPVLEPHYKLVSIVHKMVTRGDINLEQAQHALNTTSYAANAKFPEDMDDWVPYILGVLKTLRAADKSNWHHRMIARSAQIVYDEANDGSAPSQNLGAIGAKHELTQQMFTKTMVLQVWRPDSERPGRHFVYTARYTRFFVKILEQLKDRSNLEMLARRVRRRPHDVFEHAQVWQDICHAYLRLLRSHAQMPEGLETSVFSNVPHEEFLARKEPLEKWMQAQETGASPTLDVLREVQELKKINQSLMKPGPIDDLIGDSYAHLYGTMGKQLLDEEKRIKQEEEANRPPPAPPRNPMMSLTHLMNVDGASESDAAPAGQPAQQDQAPARRKIGVGRREIRATAEACFQKNAPAAAASSNKPAPSYRQVQVVIDSARDLAGDVSAATSAPGSIHDSADDESELSELEEEGDDDENGAADPDAKSKPMFPGLASEMQSRDGSEGAEGVEDAEEEDGDGGVPTGYHAVNSPEDVAAGPGGEASEQAKEREQEKMEE